ncbi:MAG: aminopeptidase P family protein [Acidobacteria bacterium]|nr:aminopeptidase P family protein [Acidobacteriota bacterium]
MNTMKRFHVSLPTLALLLTLLNAAGWVAPSVSAGPSGLELRAEVAARRARVMEKIGPQAVLIMLAAEPRLYTNDVDYEYRQENNFYYLTGLEQEGLRLILMPGNQTYREILFLPPRDPGRETWTGHMLSREEAESISGIATIRDASEFEPFVKSILNGQAVSIANGQSQGEFGKFFTAIPVDQAEVRLLTPPASTAGHSAPLAVEFRREADLSSSWTKTSPRIKFNSALPIFAELRLVKSDYELRQMQKAVDASVEAHRAAMRMIRPGMFEYQIEAEMERIFRASGGRGWGYPSIVGSGPNATTLHYQVNHRQMAAGDLLLIDAGAEYAYYSADVTRTFPVSGTFSKEQAEIYNIVLEAQSEALKIIRPGATIGQVHNRAVEVIKAGLEKLGLITDPTGTQFRTWFMHGTCHMLGMNVHDVNLPGTTLKPGMTFTVEPGIYLRLDALDYLPKSEANDQFIAAVRPAFEKYKGIGVRIEDDVVVTESGYRNMSVGAPRTIPEIEALIQTGRTSGGSRAR